MRQVLNVFTGLDHLKTMWRGWGWGCFCDLIATSGPVAFVKSLVSICTNKNPSWDLIRHGLMWKNAKFSIWWKMIWVQIFGKKSTIGSRKVWNVLIDIVSPEIHFVWENCNYIKKYFPARTLKNEKEAWIASKQQVQLLSLSFSQNFLLLTWPFS